MCNHVVNIIYDGGAFFDVKLLSILIDENSIFYSFGSEFVMVDVDSGVKLKKFVNKEKAIRTLIKNVVFIENESYDCAYIQQKTYDCLHALDYCEEKKKTEVKILSNAADILD